MNVTSLRKIDEFGIQVVLETRSRIGELSASNIPITPRWRAVAKQLKQEIPELGELVFVDRAVFLGGLKQYQLYFKEL